VSDDFIDNGLDPEPTRVDIYIRPFNPTTDKILLALRKLFAKRSVVIDMYDKYYNGEEDDE
jgi:hypothetical protein